MRRKTKVAIVGTAAGSTLLIGLGFATTASAGESGWGGDEVCATSSASAGMPTGDGSQPATETETKSKDKTKHGWWSWFHRGGGNECDPTGDPTSSGQQPSDPGTPTESTGPTDDPTATATATATATPTETSTSDCTTATGDAASIASPGTGTVTVTITVCDGVLTSSTGEVANGNWDANTPALASLDQLALEYYASDMSKLTYSGATLTSNSYQSSLQSALDSAGL